MLFTILLQEFAPWPTRFYIFRDGVMQYIANPMNDHRYDLSELRLNLERVLEALDDDDD